MLFALCSVGLVIERARDAIMKVMKEAHNTIHDPGALIAQRTWPRGVIISVVLLGPYGHDFLYFILPSVVFWLALTSSVFWIPLFFFSLESLFRLRCKLILIFAIVWALLSLRFLGVWAPTEWLARPRLPRPYPADPGLSFRMPADRIC
jgi:hypothetical protein